MMPPKRPRGRPSLYTPTLADEICRRIALGESLRRICADEEMPGQRTVFDWLHASCGDFPQQYARARAEQADTLVDEIVDVADEATCKDNASAVSVRVEARKWAAGKLAPKKYGNFERHDITLRGAVADATDADLAAIAFAGRRGASAPEENAE